MTEDTDRPRREPMDFVDHLRRQGLKPSTVAEYDKWLRRLQRWCWTRRLHLYRLTTSDILEWVESLPDTQATRKAARATLRHYCQMAGRNDHPWQVISVPAHPRMRSRALSPEDSRTLRDGALMIGGRKGLATIIGLYTAARASEIAGMRWDGFSGRRLKFARPKNRDIHEVPVHRVLAEQLDRARSDAWSEWIFPGHGQPHVGPGTVWGWIRDVGQTCNIQVTTHQLRHTSITTALEATKDLQAVQELAGHMSPAITAGYARLSQARLQAAVDALDAYETTEDEPHI